MKTETKEKAHEELLQVAQMVVGWAATQSSLTTMEKRMVSDARAAIAKAEAQS